MTALSVPGKEDFAIEVRITLLRRGGINTQLASRPGYARNSVSKAIQHGVFEPVPARIRADL